MELTSPPSLKREHEELHSDLVAAIKAGGQTGPAAQAAAQALHPHFVKEEEYAMPPLGLLTMLAKGELPQDRVTILAMIDRLNKDFSHMLHEHKAIVIQLHKLMKASREGLNTFIWLRG